MTNFSSLEGLEVAEKSLAVDVRVEPVTPTLVASELLSIKDPREKLLIFAV